MDLQKYFDMPNCEIPSEIEQKLKTQGSITNTSFKAKNDILTDEDLRVEVGYSYLKEDDCYLVSMYAPMPNVTKEMVQWWFWWHAQSSDRYRAWFPTQHNSISYRKFDKPYFSQTSVPNFQNNTHYPVEKVGKLLIPLAINFVSPEEFGFDKKLIENAKTIVCGHVSAFKDLIPNTQMAHVFFETEKGLLLVSRFWLGIDVKNKLLKKIFVTEEQAKDMAEHCCIEYRNFAQRIPQMYWQWLKEQN